MTRQRWPKRGDLVRVTEGNGAVNHGKVQVGRILKRVLVAREEVRLSEEAKAKPVSERHVTDLVAGWSYWLAGPGSVVVIPEAEADQDAKGTMLLDVGFAKRVAKAMAAGKELPES